MIEFVVMIIPTACIATVTFFWGVERGEKKALEREIRLKEQVNKLGDLEIPSVHQYVEKIEEDLAQYNQSFGDPTYTEWIDADYNKKGVK